MITRVLPNGVRLVVRESPAAPVVAMTLFVGAGSASELAPESGVTALLGRVLLKGTRRRSALAVAQTAEDAGGRLESAADQEYTELRTWGLARHWERLLDLLVEVATVPTLAEAEVSRERAVLLGQLQGLLDEPAHVASRALARALYGPGGYGLAPGGEVETVAGLGQERVAARFGAAWMPGEMVLAVSGAVTEDDVAAAVAGRLAGIPAGGPAPSLPAAPARPVEDRRVETRPSQQAQVMLGCLAPPIGHPDYVPLKLATAVLGGGMSSRLFRHLRDEAGLAYSVGAVYPSRRGSGRVVVHIGTAPATAAAAEVGIRRELDRLREEPVPDDELRRTKAYVLGTLALDRRTNARQSFYLGFYELSGVGAGYLARYPGLLEAVTSADVQRVVRRWLGEPVTVVVGPGGAGAGGG